MVQHNADLRRYEKPAHKHARDQTVIPRGLEASTRKDTTAPDSLPFRCPDMPFGSTSHGGTHLYPAGWKPSRLDWQSA